MKRKILLLALLVLSAGVLSVLVSTTHVVRAVGGSVGGGVFWVDQYGNLRPMAWAQVTAQDVNGGTFTAYTTEGSYVLWLPPGTYTLTASSDPGFLPDSAPNVVVSAGSSTSMDFTLQPSGRPIPELPAWTVPIIVLGTLMTTAAVVRRQKTRIRN